MITGDEIALGIIFTALIICLFLWFFWAPKEPKPVMRQNPDMQVQS